MSDLPPEAPSVPEVSVIIPTFRDWEPLQTCLDYLTRQTLPAERFEIIVANNNPDPDVPPWLRLPSNARILHAPQPGSYAARNKAVAEARAPALAFTDSDCQPMPRWLEAGLEELARLGPMGRVAGALTMVPQGERWTIAEHYDRIFSLQQEEYARAGWGATANLFVTRAAFDLAGPFRADIFSGDDQDWNLRAKAKGSPLAYSAEADVRHPARGSYAELVRKRRRLMGGNHQRRPRSRLRQLSRLPRFLLPQKRQVARIWRASGLTTRERFALLWMNYRLGLVTLGEIVRLQFLGGTPQRR
jgi:glycosyltransferase involved in cell wall biosynthesis